MFYYFLLYDQGITEAQTSTLLVVRLSVLKTKKHCKVRFVFITKLWSQMIQKANFAVCPCDTKKFHYTALFRRKRRPWSSWHLHGPNFFITKVDPQISCSFRYPYYYIILNNYKLILYKIRMRASCWRSNFQLIYVRNSHICFTLGFKPYSFAFPNFLPNGTCIRKFIFFSY